MARPAKKTEARQQGFLPDTLQKLEEAFLKGMNNREACFLANISESLFYDVVKNNPELSNRFDLLAERVKVKAKVNIAEAIEKGDIAQSNWYLERKAKSEFSTRQELAGVDGKDLIPDPEIKKKSDEVIDQFLKGTTKQ